MLDPPIAARLIFTGDITQPGPHRAQLADLSPIAIFPSRSWGGGRVTIPKGSVTAEFTVRALPDNFRPVTAQGKVVPKPELRSYQITSVKGTIRSFAFPRNVVTGPNSFVIIPEKSYVQVHGSEGTVAIDGEAQAWLTNKVFSKAKPARVRVSFWGTYNFKDRVAVFSRFEAHAHSRG
jgi:hypothetical protein